MNNINTIIKELKEYQELEIQLKSQIEELKTQAIELLLAEGLDEFTCNEGKITYGELYKAFTTQTTAMRFTCN
ncbi:MAG: hypothetical protein IJ141_00070 [Lachnospiraceae bacterium]|nr:hypothetical protein [Lachnospiraceae bacterium]